MPCLLHQFRYNMMDRACEGGRLPAAVEENCGSILFSPVAQGQLTGKYMAGAVPQESRAARSNSVFLNESQVQANAERVAALAQLAQEAGLPLTQLALRWLLQRKGVTSVLIGARTVSQLDDCAAATGQEPLPADLMKAIDQLPPLS